MLIATEIPRVFNITHKGEKLALPDPDSSWTAEAVLNHYTGVYPELTTASVGQPELKDDTLIYNFSSIIGTKG
jgi:PRTRC genetic system protein C